MRVVYRELALADLDQIFRYLDARSPAGARNVTAAIYAAINNIADKPLSSRETSDPGIRVKVVGRYGYKIFYSVGNDAVEILHVRHGAPAALVARTIADVRMGAACAFRGIVSTDFTASCRQPQHGTVSIAAQR